MAVATRTVVNQTHLDGWVALAAGPQVQPHHLVTRGGVQLQGLEWIREHKPPKPGTAVGHVVAAAGGLAYSANSGLAALQHVRLKVRVPTTAVLASQAHNYHNPLHKTPSRPPYPRVHDDPARQLTASVTHFA